MLTADTLRGKVRQWADGTWLKDMRFACSDGVYAQAIENFAADYARWYPADDEIDLAKLEHTPQLIAVLMYRIARLLYLEGCEPWAADEFSLLGREIGHCELYYSASIGSGFKINHGLGTVVGARSTIGDNCTIHQGCTLGDRAGGRPTVGNNVMIYAGSSILGDIHIGDNSVIGANSLVIGNFPAGSVIAGSPAKILHK